MHLNNIKMLCILFLSFLPPLSFAEPLSVAVAANFSPPIKQNAVLLNKGKRNPLAKYFLRYLPSAYKTIIDALFALLLVLPFTVLLFYLQLFVVQPLKNTFTKRLGWFVSYTSFPLYNK